MARRRGKKSYGGGRSNKLMKGILPVSGIIASVLLGAGAATLQEKILPQYHPLQGTAVGFAVGGVGGALGAYGRNMLSGKTTSGSGYNASGYM